MSSSCDSAKTASTDREPENKTVNAMESKLQAEGYLSAVIKYQAGSKCTYVLVNEKSQLKYDPINIDEEKFMSFKKDSEKVYFKYRALRMMNRCDDAQPIEIEDIKKRED